MISRPINREAAGLADSIDTLWRDVRRATTGNFATKASLEAADAALAKLLNSATTDLRELRVIIRAEIAALAEADRAETVDQERVAS